MQREACFQIGMSENRLFMLPKKRHFITGVNEICR